MRSLQPIALRGGDVRYIEAERVEALLRHWHKRFLATVEDLSVQRREREHLQRLWTAVHTQDAA